MSKFTKLQPKDGDVCCICAHISKNENKPFHFFLVDGFKARRPDGSLCIPQWIIICNHCLTLYPTNPFCCISDDQTWSGNGPVVKEAEEN